MWSIKYIHSNLIINRNLKTNNIFLIKDNHIKLREFDILSFLHDEILVNIEKGIKHYYLSPEIIYG